MPAPATQPSSCSNVSTVRAVSLHMAIVLASLIAASVTLVACGPGASHAQAAPGAGGPPPAAVVVMSLAATNLAMNYEYVGQTAGSREVEVRARVTGILLTRNFNEGGRVKKGQSLFTIDPAPFQAAVDRADADVAAAEAACADHAHRESPEAAVRGERGEPERIRRRGVGRADGARRPQGRAGAPRRGRAQPRLHQGRGTGLRRRGPLAGERGHAGLRTRHAADHGDAGRPDLGELRHRRQRADAVAQRSGRGPAAAAAARGVHDRSQARGRQRLPAQGQAPLLRRAGLGNTGTVEARPSCPTPTACSARPVRARAPERRDAAERDPVPQRAVLEGPQGKFVYVAAEARPRRGRCRSATVGDDWIITSGLAEASR